MAWTTLQNSTTADATEVNNNFYHIRQGNLLPLSGASLNPASANYDIGSSVYKWRHGFFSGSVTAQDVVVGETFQVNTVGSGKFYVYSNGAVTVNQQWSTVSGLNPASYSLYVQRETGNIVVTDSISGFADVNYEAHGTRYFTRVYGSSNATASFRDKLTFGETTAFGPTFFLDVAGAMTFGVSSGYPISFVPTVTMNNGLVVNSGTVERVTAQTLPTIIVAKDSAISHSMTTYLESNAYFQLRAAGNSNGGAEFTTWYGGSAGNATNIYIGQGASNSIGNGSSAQLNNVFIKDDGSSLGTTYSSTSNLITIKNGLISGTKYVFRADGTAYADVSWSTFSDKKIKRNVKDLEYGLKEVLEVRPISFQRDHVKETQIGVIAQEIKEIIPEVVSGSKTENGLLGVDYSKITVVLINAIKELKQQLDELKNNA